MDVKLFNLCLLLGWLMLNESASAGQWLLGAALAIAIPAVLAPLRPTRATSARTLPMPPRWKR